MLTSLTLLAFASPFSLAQEWQDLAKEIARTDNGYAVADVSRRFADVRAPEAMEARVEIFADKLELRGGVHLRDWLYTGMLRFETEAEAEVLLETASARKEPMLLRTTSLHALRRGKGPVPVEPLLEKRWTRSDVPLLHAWQAAAGQLLADDRLRFTRPDKERRELRSLLLDAGLPYLGFRGLPPQDDELTEMRASYLKSKSAEDQAQFLFILAGHARDEEACRQLYLELLPGSLDPASHRSLRVAAWASALRGSVVEAVPSLITGLTRASEDAPSRHPADLAAALRHLTGQQFGTQPERWSSWWSERGAAWLAEVDPNQLAAPSKDEAEAEDTVARVFGIPVDSHRVAFVLDGSGSMLDELSDGLRGADAAAEELEAFLDRLPDDAWMQLHLIVRDRQSPFDEAVKASKKNRKQAIEFVRRFEFGPASAMFDVLVEAQLDPRIDTIVFVSDGGGSWGSYAFSEHMLDLLAWQHERTGVRIHAICVGQDRNKARFMERLAAATSGRMVQL